MLDGTGGARWQKRSKEEEITRRDNNDIVVFGVEFFQERNGTPAGTYLSSIAASQKLRNIHT